MNTETTKAAEYVITRVVAGEKLYFDWCGSGEWSNAVPAEGHTSRHLMCKQAIKMRKEFGTVTVETLNK